MGLKLQKDGSPTPDMDMTPMIDMVFQLIAFFMMLINFSQNETNKRIELPLSSLAVPVEDSADLNFITLHVDDKQETIVMSAEEYTLATLEGALAKRRSELEGAANGFDVSKTRVIIRADKKAETGLVQRVIEACQKAHFENFKLRAQYKKPE
ncbi:MAG: biopolymer transporter ExbD [Pirellulales bacterium]